MTSVCRNGSVEFEFYRRDVTRVSVVGDFASDWRGGELQMTGDGNGWWRLSAALNAGEYRFRYLADGQWYTDYASNGIEVGEMGVNSVLVVPERETSAPPMRAARMVA